MSVIDFFIQLRIVWFVITHWHFDNFLIGYTVITFMSCNIYGQYNIYPIIALFIVSVTFQRVYAHTRKHRRTTKLCI